MSASAPLFSGQALSLPEQYEQLQRHLKAVPDYKISFGMFRLKNGDHNHNAWISFTKDGHHVSISFDADSLEDMMARAIELIKNPQQVKS